MGRPNTQNLIPARKGEPSRNPAGRPKGSKNIATILRKYLKCNLEAKNPFTQEIKKLSAADIIELQLITKAIKSDLAAIKEIHDRLEGRPDTISHTIINQLSQTNVVKRAAESDADIAERKRFVDEFRELIQDDGEPLP